MAQVRPRPSSVPVLVFLFLVLVAYTTASGPHQHGHFEDDEQEEPEHTGPLLHLLDTSSLDGLNGHSDLPDNDHYDSGFDNAEEETTPARECLEGQFKCRYSGDCIPRGWLCDGQADCGVKLISESPHNASLGLLSSPFSEVDSSDEEGAQCNHSSLCPLNFYRCANLISCIPLERLCDGHTGDCPDNSDEDTFCANQTACSDLHCDHGCKPNSKGGGECFCPQGMQYNGSTCVAISACLYEELCEQECLTTSPSKYECRCKPGYRLVEPSICVAINDPPEQLLLSIAIADRASLTVSQFHFKKAFSERAYEWQLHPQTTHHLRNETLYPSLHFPEPFALSNGTLIGQFAELLLTFDVNFSNRTFCYLDRVSPTQQFIDAWTASPYNRIHCATFDPKPASTWTYSLGSSLHSLLFTSQLVFEWVSGNWYGLDSTHELVFLCNSSFAVCDNVIDSQLNKPQMIALDANAGYLFYLERGPTARLGRTTLDGLNGSTLAQERMVYPNHLALDLANEYVYWTDTYIDTVERVRYDGTGRKSVLRHLPGTTVISFDLYERHMYLLLQEKTATKQSLLVLDLFNRHSSVPLLLNSTSAMSLRTVHRARQPLNRTHPHPCSVGNGNCAHLCIPTYTGNGSGQLAVAKCRCAIGYRPDPRDSRQCLFVDSTTPKMLYVRGSPGAVKMGTLKASGQLLDSMTIPTTPLSRPISLAYDPLEGTLLYSDLQRYAIVSRQIDGKTLTAGNTNRSRSPLGSVFVEKGVIRCEGIAIDLTGRNVYWTDSALGAISVARLEDSSLRKQVISTELAHPKSILLHGQRLYWSDWSFNASVSGKIERSALDGTQRSTLIGEKLSYPNGLAVDPTGGHLYWCDSLSKTLERTDLNGDNRKLVLSGEPLGHPYSVAYHGEALYWTDYREGTIRWLDVHSGLVETLLNESSPLYDLKILDETYLKAPTTTSSNACAPLSCAHLCLGTAMGRICACADGFQLAEDEKTCTVLANYTRPSLCDAETEFECRHTAQCIDGRHICDGVADCVDNSDEDTSPGGICEKRLICTEGSDNCRTAENGTCSTRQFKCDTGACIPNAWLCDGQLDCGHGDDSDERNCADELCDEESMFRCTNRRCISLAYVCDGQADCKDASDELNCKKCNTRTELTCDKGKCLPIMLRCNNVIDCIDATDELNCPPGVTVHQQHHLPHANGTAAHKEAKDCLPSKLYCQPLGTCLSPSLVLCNEKMDCPNGIDELHCPNATIPPSLLNPPNKNNSHLEAVNCLAPNRTCLEKTSQKSICLPLSRWCDNTEDCVGGADEGGMCAEDLCFFSDCKGHCHNVPYAPGHVCYCEGDGLRLAVDGVSCTAAHPCEQWGVCSQVCTPRGKHSFTCACTDGYQLDPADGFTCKSVLPMAPLVVFSNRHEIRSINLHTDAASLLLSGLKNTIALDYLYRANASEVFVFWADVLEDKIYHGELVQGTLTNIESILEGGLTAAEGLAVDWIGENLYWVESTLDQIEVAKVNGSYRKTLITENLSSPRAISLDPQEATMFWTDWDADKPRIEAASMDGTGRRIVTTVRSGSWPNGIALDLILKRIYWIDAKTDTLSTIGYDGSDKRDVLLANEYLTHPFAMNLYENSVFWTDWRTNSLVSANKWNGSQVTVITRTFTQPFDVKIVHPSRQPGGEQATKHRCVVDNGACSHLCLLAANSRGYSCDCPHSMRLDGSARQCVLNSVFLLLSKPNDVRGIDLDRPSHFTMAPISMPKVLNPIQLDYVLAEKSIYWADSQLNEVKRYSLLTGQVEPVIETVIQQPQAFAVDWASGNLWVAAKEYTHGGAASVDFLEEEEEEEETTGAVLGEHETSAGGKSGGSAVHPVPIRLYVCSLSGEYLSALPPLVNFTNPQSLALDPLSGYLYWTEYVTEKVRQGNVTLTQSRSALLRALMDGTGARLLSHSGTNPLLQQPSSLQLDPYTTGGQRRLYWVNLRSHSIQYLDLHDLTTAAPVTIYPVTQPTISHLLMDEPTSLTIFGERLFVSFHQDGTLRTMNKHTGADESLFYNGTDDLLSIRLYDAKLQRGSNACSKEANNNSTKACSHLCVPTGVNRRKCLCALGFTLHQETQCLARSEMLLFSSNNGLRAVDLDHALRDTKSSLAEQVDALNHAQATMANGAQKTGPPSLLPPMAKILLASSLDFDSRQETLFWGDADEGSFSSIGRDTSHYQRLLSGLEKLVDLAVDWNAGNVYWTEETYATIEVMRLETKSRLVLVVSQTGKPASLALHPGEGLLFWADNALQATSTTSSSTTRSPTMVRIERATLDGANRRVIYEKPASEHTIGDLAVDTQRNVLYFADIAEQTIGSIDFEGANERRVVGKAKSPIALALKDGLLFWADTHLYGGAILVLNPLKHAGMVNISGNATSIGLLQMNLGDHLKDIAVYSERPLYESNPCARDNGGCADLCFFLGRKAGHRCACAYGYISPADNATCLPYDVFLMYSRGSTIDSVKLALPTTTTPTTTPNSPYPPISHPSLRNVIALACDYSRRRLLYSDIQKGTISWCFFNGSDHQLLLERQGPIEGLAYDERGQTLYWTAKADSSLNSLDLMNLEDERSLQADNFTAVNAARRVKLLKLSPHDRLRGIAIDSCHGRLYWTNWNLRAPSIQRAHITGDRAVESIITENIRQPNAILLDLPLASLYWSDAKLSKIEKCDLDGAHCLVLLSKTPQHPFALALYEERLFWSDWQSNSLLSCNKHTGHEVATLGRGTTRPMGLVVVAPPLVDDCPSSSFNPCSFYNGGCEDVCNVLNKTQHGAAVCSCYEGRHLAPDRRRCAFPEPTTGSPSPVNGSSCSEVDGDFECTPGGVCIPLELTCDGTATCPNGADEELSYCASRLCPPTFHQCSSENRCIRRSKVCDEIVHCSDGSDEKACDCKQAGMFKCKGTGICIDETLRCNEEPECPDASDETDCPPPDCSIRPGHGGLPMVNCPHTTGCISAEWICDGKKDCWDNSDEENCPLMVPVKPNTNSTATVQHHWRLANGTASFVKNVTRTSTDGCDDPLGCPTGVSICEHGQFQCADGQCLPGKLYCDGKVDCTDATDEPGEQQCAASLGPSRACDPTSEYRCSAKTTAVRCIPRSWICNSIQDCPGGDDEMPSLCGNDAKASNGTKEMTLARCPPGNFTCNNQVCIDASLICNGQNDCGDFSDENQCNVDECETASVCAQRCTDYPIGYKCSCFEGFEPYDGGRVCKDVDECSPTDPAQSSPCPQLCRNTYGSYICYCAPGYQLEGATCRAISTVPLSLLLTTETSIRQLRPDTPQPSILLSALNNAVALDYDWTEQCLFWSEMTLQTAAIRRVCSNRSESTAAGGQLSSFDGSTIETLHSSTLRFPDGIAVDWIGRNLYWLDKGTDTLEVSRLDGTLRRVLLRQHLDEPRAIVLNPLEGLLFWSDWGEKPHIGRAAMDGTGARLLLEESLGWPNALTLDYVRGELYYADARLDYIAVVDFSGNRRRVLFDGRRPSPANGPPPPSVSLTGHIFSLTFFESSLYWSDWMAKAVVSCQVDNCTAADFDILYATEHRPMDVKVFHPLRQPPLPEGGKTPCPTGPNACLGLCLLRPKDSAGGGLSSVCTCPEDYILAEDGRSCASNCTYSQFVCPHTYKCIPSWWKCDTQNDCGDNYDEPADCPPFKCHPGEYMCKEGTANETAKGAIATPTECLLPHQICNSVKDCLNGDDEDNCDLHVCTASQFKCPASGEESAYCIASSSRCDGLRDCTGGEDELNCDCDLRTQFRCANGRCIPRAFHCDGQADCDSDEVNCSLASNCTEQEFKCHNGQCIPIGWRCDGESTDCITGEDELGCNQTAVGNATVCDDETHFRCANGHCIQLFYRCDGDFDCSDGSDEVNCTLRECTSDEFHCKSGHCIDASLRCNADDDCPDASDEVNCPPEACQESELQCPGPSRLCILKEWTCDGDFDCPSGEEERNCSSHCLAKDFTCANEQCVYAHFRCDGENDCLDGSDETPQLCATLACPLNKFRCRNGICLPKYRLCDGHDDCGDGTDENEPMCRAYNRECLSGLSALHANRFVCANKHCIDGSLRCNLQDDCGDNSDEVNCPYAEEDTSKSHVWEHCPFGLCSQTCTWRKGNVSEAVRKHQTRSNLTVACQCAHGYTRMALLSSPTTTPTPTTTGNDSTKLGGDSPVGGISSQQSTCQATGRPAVLLVTTDSGFRLVNPYKNTFQELYSLFSAGAGPSTVPLPLGLTNRSTLSRIESVELLYRKTGQWSLFWGNPHRSALYRVDISSLEGVLQTGVRDLKGAAFHGRITVKPSAPVTLSEPAEVATGVSNPRGLAINWLAEHLYWIDAATTPTIAMANIDGSQRRTILTGPPLESPFDLLVDPKNCYLFWTDTSYSSVKIGRSNLKGTDWRPLVSSDLEWPLGLALDLEADRLYWTDPKAATIESVRVDGTDRRRVHSLASHKVKPNRLDVFEDHLYVSTIASHQLLRLDKFGRKGGKRMATPPLPLAQGIAKLTDLVLGQEHKQPAGLPNPCRPTADNNQQPSSSSPCGPSFLCVALSSTTFDCLCPDGYRKMLTNRNESECVPISPSATGSKSESACPCINGGRCRYLPDETLFCQCPPLYEGQLCEQFRCTNYCLNHGSCYIDLSQVAALFPSLPITANQSKQGIERTHGQPRCLCADGWKGARCQEPQPNTCQMDSCLNGGTCSVAPNAPQASPSPSSVKCTCLSPFTGTQCEECPSEMLCHNSGTCTRQGNGQYGCTCAPGFGGAFCEVHLCSPLYCHENGLCAIQRRRHFLEDTDTPTAAQGSDISLACACFRGFTGERCNSSNTSPFTTPANPSPSSSPPRESESSSSLVESCTSLHCANGGTCHQLSRHRAVCLCPYGVTGSLCESGLSTMGSGSIPSLTSGKTALDGHPSSSTYNVLAYLLLGVVALLMGGLLIFRLHDSLCKKVQSELAFQHQRISDNGSAERATGADGGHSFNNVEILNPIFNLNTANVDAQEEQMETEFIVSYTNTNFANPIYEYKKRLQPNAGSEETVNLLEHHN